MSKILTPLLAGAALLAGGGAVASAHEPAAAAREAAEDARAAAAQARADARAARDEARREVRIYRGGPDAGVYVMRGGDRAEHLRTILQLRPDQDAALKTYLEAVTPTSDALRAVDRIERRDEAPTTPERLARMEQRLAEQQAGMRQRIDATRTFYGQLDARQKKVFDALPMLMFAGPGFGPMLMPAMHMPPPPAPPAPPPPAAPEPPRGL